MIDPLGGELWQVLQGDAATVLRTLPDGCVNFSMTSPPYFALRSYLNQNSPLKAMELGSEKLHDCNGWATGSRCGCCYICRLVAVFAELKRVLRDDGVCVVNISDTFASDGYGARGKREGELSGGGCSSWRDRSTGAAKTNHLVEGGLLGIPWRFALAMQVAGWCLRSSVIWGKLSPMPESVQGWRWERHRIKAKEGGRGGNGNARMLANANRIEGVNRCSDAALAEWEPCPGCPKCRDTGGYVLRKGSWRPTRSHEHVFVFTKGGRYWCDGDAVRTPAAASTLSRDQYSRIIDNNDEPYAVAHDHETVTNPLGANLRDVLWLGPEPGKQAVILRALPDCPVHKGVMPYRHGQTEGPIYVEVMPKSWNKCDCKTRHFAAFPSTLCRPLLEAYCPQRCCAECGTGWVRVVERETGEPANHKGSSFLAGKTGANGMGRVGGGERTVTTTTLGWRPACNCQSQAVPVPGLCLDPFSGTGTLALTARRMGLRALGIELSESYCVLSRERLRRDQALFAQAAAFQVEVQSEPVPDVPEAPGLFDTLED